MSSYSKYRGQSIGRIIHFLHHYCAYHDATHSTIGNDEVRIGGMKLADVKWSPYFGEKDVPEFVFFGDNAELYSENQMERRKEAIEESVIYQPELIEPMEVDKRIVMAMAPEGFMRATTWASCCDLAKPIFLLGKRYYSFSLEDNLYFDTPKRRYVWNRDLKDWLLDEIFPVNQKEIK